MKGQEEWIVVVETGKSFREVRALRRWRAFVTWAQGENRRAVLFAPEQDIEEVKRYLHGYDEYQGYAEFEQY